MKIVEKGAFKGLDIDRYCKKATFEEHQIFMGFVIESLNKPPQEKVFSPSMLPISVREMLLACGAYEIYA